MLEIEELEAAVVRETETRGRNLGAELTAQGLAQCNRVAVAVNHGHVRCVLAHFRG